MPGAGARAVRRLHVVDRSKGRGEVRRHAAVDHVEHLLQGVPPRARVSEHRRNQIALGLGIRAWDSEVVGLLGVKGVAGVDRLEEVVGRIDGQAGLDVLGLPIEAIGAGNRKPGDGRTLVGDQARSRDVVVVAGGHDHEVDLSGHPGVREFTHETLHIGRREGGVVRGSRPHEDHVLGRDPALLRIVVGHVQGLGIGRVHDQ